MEDERGVPLRPRERMAGILEDCRHWAAEFGPRSPSLYMYGYAGLGKTHLALSIAQRVLERGFDVIYVSAQRAFATIAAGEDDGELYETMLEADLLVLDDLGTEYLNAYLRSRLYDLVNTRMRRRPTIYTSNICSQELLEQRYDEKTASRLLGECHLMRFWGEDIRLQRG
jgi:DNA replication protein DnaC